MFCKQYTKCDCIVILRQLCMYLYGYLHFWCMDLCDCECIPYHDNKFEVLQFYSFFYPESQDLRELLCKQNAYFLWMSPRHGARRRLRHQYNEISQRL